MVFSVTLLALAAQLAVAHSETIHGAILFSRHGDRTWKGAPPTKLTTIGQIEAFNSGTYWRDRYLNSSSPFQISGINAEIWSAAQLTAAAPIDAVLVTTGQAFLQGLYPPVQVFDTLANGNSIEAPLSGYQYAPLTTVTTDSPSTIWLKGDDQCPVYDDASAQWNTTDQYKALEASTKNFYQSFYDKIFAGVMPQSKMSYANAYTIFDYINVGVVHNSTIADVVTSEQLFQLRTLANSAEFAKSGYVTSNSNIRAVSGRTLSGKVLSQLEAIISSKGKQGMFNLNLGSYDTFLSFFGLANLPSVSVNFTGLPDYASVIVFELFSDSTDFPAEADLSVRFLFRNGTTQGPAQTYPLFGSQTLSWSDFKARMEKIAITSVEQWCNFCNSTASFCSEFKSDATATSTEGNRHKNEVTPAVAGVIGGMVTLGVFSLAAIV
ncbi:histidine phosphatase superfamily, partial [Sphaerosporella brunnea]